MKLNLDQAENEGGRRILERKEREIEIFDFAQNRVGPQRIYRKPSSIDRGGIELLSRTKTRQIERYRGGVDDKGS